MLLQSGSGVIKKGMTGGWEVVTMVGGGGSKLLGGCMMIGLGLLTHGTMHASPQAHA